MRNEMLCANNNVSWPEKYLHTRTNQTVLKQIATAREVWKICFKLVFSIARLFWISLVLNCGSISWQSAHYNIKLSIHIHSFLTFRASLQYVTCIFCRNVNQALQYNMTCISVIGRTPFNPPRKFFRCNMMLDWVFYTPLKKPFYINASLPLLSRVQKQVKLLFFLTGVTKFNTTLSYTWPPRKRRKLVYKSQVSAFLPWYLKLTFSLSVCARIS